MVARLFILIFCVVAAQAVYYMDDRNITIFFSEQFWMDPDDGAFRRTLTYASECGTSDKCLMTLPFTGSGITLYVAHGEDTINSTVTVDGTISTTKQVYIGETGVEGYNVTLYDIQKLPFATHTVSVSLVSLSSGQGSDLWFDYAAINDTVYIAPATTAAGTSSSLAATSTASVGSPTTAPSSSVVIGPIVGGAVGGVTVASVVVLLLIFLKRKQSRRLKFFNGETEPKPYGLFTDREGGRGPPLFVQVLDLLTQHESTASSSILQSANASHTNVNNIVTSPLLPPTASSLAVGSPALLQALASNSQMSDEQANFIRSLWAANVPAADIARLIARMPTEGSAMGPEQIRLGNRAMSHAADSVAGDTPPRYES